MTQLLLEEERAEVIKRDRESKKRSLESLIKVEKDAAVEANTDDLAAFDKYIDEVVNKRIGQGIMAIKNRDFPSLAQALIDKESDTRDIKRELDVKESEVRALERALDVRKSEADALSRTFRKTKEEAKTIRRTSQEICAPPGRTWKAKVIRAHAGLVLNKVVNNGGVANGLALIEAIPLIIERSGWCYDIINWCSTQGGVSVDQMSEVKLYIDVLQRGTGELSACYTKL